MPADQVKRRVSYVILCITLIVITVMFGVRATYPQWLYYAIVGLLLILITSSTLALGGSSIRSKDDSREMSAAAGMLLIAPWGLFTLLAGYGRPDQATNAENQFRYLILMINSIAVAGGLIMVRQVVSERKERFFSTLGSVSIGLATPLYLIWGAIMYEAQRLFAGSAQENISVWINALSGLTDTLLFFGGFLTYLATAMIVMSLGRTQMLGRKAVWAYLTICVVALACLAARGLQFPDPNVVFQHWYLIPGWIAGIPAIPWIMPCLLGVAFLRDARER